MKSPNSVLLLMLFILLAGLVLVVDTLTPHFVPVTAAAENPQAMTVAGRAQIIPGQDFQNATLTQHEVAHMRFMREEEKLAHDVYALFSTHWAIPVFAKITQAEQRHTEAVHGLLNFYGVPDPATGRGPGQFEDQKLAELYQALVSKGNLSLDDALMVGGLIEEVDIADLENAIASTTRPDIIRVYHNIHRGSRNHLRSFARALALDGIAYQPQKLLANQVATILSSPMENGPPQ